MRYHRRQCALYLCLVAFAAGPLPAQQVIGAAGIRGTITANGRPLPDTRVVRVGSVDTVRSDSLGHFAIEHLARGRHIFNVVKRGFQPIEMEVSFPTDTVLTVEIPMEPAAAPSMAKLERVGFVERRRRDAAERRPRAVFLGPDEIAERAPARAIDLLDGVHDITIQNVGAIPSARGTDNHCVMYVFVDSVQVDNVFPPDAGSMGRRAAMTRPTYTGLDGLVQPGQIAAMEIYPRAATVPREFRTAPTQVANTGRADFETRSAECGAILIWTTAP